MYRDLLLKTLNELQDNDSITISYRSLGGTDMGSDAAKTLHNGLIELSSLELPEEYIDCIRTGGEFAIYWNMDNCVFGEFELLPIENAIMGMDDTQLWHNEMSNSDIEFYKSLQTIDIHGQSGDGQYSALFVDKRSIPTEIWFINRDAKYKLELDYGSYINALIETRGLHGWQYFYLSDYESLKKNNYDLNRAKGLMENTLIGLEKLFPDVSVATYKKKYEKLYN